jgi:hypothetical protein
MYITGMARKKPSNQIRMYCTFLFIDSAYTQKTRPRKVDDTVEKEKDLASTSPLPQPQTAL